MTNDSASTTQLTYYQKVEREGHSNRNFTGLDKLAIGQVVKAIKGKPCVPAIWLHFRECTCCSKSFIRLPHLTIADILMLKGKKHMNIGHHAMASFIYFLTFWVYLAQCFTGFGLYAGISNR